MHWQVTFWGTRGSIPTPGPGTARYGGNTACISISSGDGRLVILDAGSGLRPLGHELMKQRNGIITADILLSHTHWDHIQGLPFFKPLSARDTSVTIYGAAQEGVALGLGSVKYSMTCGRDEDQPLCYHGVWAGRR